MLLTTTSLSPAQLATLKADILADSAFAGLFAEEIANAYNLLASPAFVVWRTAVEAIEWRAAIIGGGGAGQLDGLSASKRDALLWAVSDTLDPSNANVRSALDDFCGSQAVLKAALQEVQKRSATRAEKLFSTGAGSVVSPATMGWEGRLTYQDVEAAQQLP